jgi:hypothetical protein
LLAPKTRIGPSGIDIFLKSGLGTGVLSGSAVSIDALTQSPFFNKSEKDLICPTVLPNSPFALPSANPVSSQ